MFKFCVKLLRVVSLSMSIVCAGFFATEAVYGDQLLKSMDSFLNRFRIRCSEDNSDKNSYLGILDQALERENDKLEKDKPALDNFKKELQNFRDSKKKEFEGLLEKLMDQDGKVNYSDTKSNLKLLTCFSGYLRSASLEDIRLVQEGDKTKLQQNELWKNQRKFIDYLSKILSQDPTGRDRLISDLFKKESRSGYFYGLEPSKRAILDIAYSPVWSKDDQLELIDRFNELKIHSIACGYGFVKYGKSDSKLIVPLLHYLCYRSSLKNFNYDSEELYREEIITTNEKLDDLVLKVNKDAVEKMKEFDKNFVLLEKFDSKHFKGYLAGVRQGIFSLLSSWRSAFLSLFQNLYDLELFSALKNLSVGIMLSVPKLLLVPVIVFEDIFFYQGELVLGNRLNPFLFLFPPIFLIEVISSIFT